MKATKLLLRWYKSFNISYRQDGPARQTEQQRPWNHLYVSEKYQDKYPFIEIPLECDITTVVGGNESGKSHLLSAISKVLTGTGIDGTQFAQTDLCRYATIPEFVENSDRWANLGISFSTTDQGQDLDVALRAAGIVDASHPQSIVLIIGGNKDGVAANVFIDGAVTPRSITAEGLSKLRKFLPSIEFIEARAALPDNLTLLELTKTITKSGTNAAVRYPHAIAQEAAAIMQQVPHTVNQPLPPEIGKQIGSLKERLSSRREGVFADSQLAARLLCDVLGIKPSAILETLGLTIEQRGYIDYHVDGWNQKIAERLNLKRFWRQDDHAALKLRYRDGTLYFDITDKTGATYTFKERSSGLRYFLSYYIQAKSMEAAGRNKNAIILMDEPDSFLSVLGQKNLLSVFESLVNYESSNQTCQLIYTTHSPFLINQNFPRRVRVVIKEEAEEGTQYHGRASARRYEPVRSALGISCAQTLFMGATNLVLEGPSDQYLLTEVIRLKAAPENISEWLDLNTIVVVPADGVDNVERVLAASRWGDEPVPATVVLIDSDRPDVIERITGKAQRCPPLIDPEFATTIGDLMGPESGGNFVTIEDLVPWDLYASALTCYVKRWRPTEYDGIAGKLAEELKRNSSDPHAIRASKALSVASDKCLNLDKLGVLAEVIEIARDSGENTATRTQVEELSRRVKGLCAQLTRLVGLSRQRASQQSATQSVKRLVREFLQSREQGASVADLVNMFARLGRELGGVGPSGEVLLASITKLRGELEALQKSGQTRMIGEDWHNWRDRLEQMRRDPLEYRLKEKTTLEATGEPLGVPYEPAGRENGLGVAGPAAAHVTS